MEDDIRIKIKALVDKYEKAKISGELKSYTEEDTKNGLIIPLFKILGWDFTNRSEISAEEKMSAGRVDFGFYFGDRPQFYLEAKPARADLKKEEYANQAIRYSWNKGATWAVLTNFENLIVFNAQDIEKSLEDKIFFNLNYAKYLENIDQLCLLSRESFKNNLIDKEAEKWGKKIQRVSVTSVLYKDLQKCRELLMKDLKACNGTIDNDLIDEGVQKLLDRLLFIRVAEDRGIEPPTLIPMSRESIIASSQARLYETMVEKFRELDEIYNSNLFSPHPFEQWEEFSGVTSQVINILYGKKGFYEYDFKAMPADVLGTVYENYLAYKLSRSKNRATVAKDAGKRKEQGIYYTPRFIVDYIVKNALGPILDGCHSVESLSRITVLDPACGSGSFLIRAFEMIKSKYIEFGFQYSEAIGVKILTENIYGVDLDGQAVEIARLNLLIGALSERVKLPRLDRNIKNGNSLISGTDEELKKYFGKDFAAKKPFNWQEEFPEVFAQGGFDCIIGNPPYVRNRELDVDDKEFYGDNYSSAQGQYDLYQLFFERGILILKNNGLLGFITSNKYAIADYGKKLRALILDNCKIAAIVDVSNVDVFKDASTYPYVIILEKNKDNAGNQIKCRKVGNENEMNSAVEIAISQDEIKQSATQNFTLKEAPAFFDKIEKASVKLGEIASIKETIHTGNVRSKLIVDERVDDNCHKLLAGKDCHRYWFEWAGKWIRYDKGLIDKSKKEYANLIDKKYFEEPKIFLREIALNIECCYDELAFYALNKAYSVQSLGNYNLKYILALLNSKLLSFYFKQQFEEAHVSGGYLQFKKIYTSQIPIYLIDFSDKKEKAKHDNLAALGQKITELTRKMRLSAENSEEWNRIKAETDKTDAKINAEVYSLYGLTPEEVRIIEQSSK